MNQTELRAHCLTEARASFGTRPVTADEITEAAGKLYRFATGEADKPKTKMVWIVTVEEGDSNSGGTCASEDEAIEYARGFLSLPGVVVTLSTREVPA